MTRRWLLVIVAEHVSEQHKKNRFKNRAIPPTRFFVKRSYYYTRSASTSFILLYVRAQFISFLVIQIKHIFNTPQLFSNYLYIIYKSEAFDY